MVIQSAPYRQWAVTNQHVSLLWLRALSSERHMAGRQSASGTALVEDTASAADISSDAETSNIRIRYSNLLMFETA